MSELDIYAKQGFAQTVGLGDRPAVVVVDFINGFTDPDHFGGGNIDPAIERTVELLELARARGLPIAHTRVVYADDGSDAGAFARKAPGLLKLTETSPLSQFVPQLQPRPRELIVKKRHASAFFGTDFGAWLTWNRIDTLLVAGCTTSGCVRATVVDSSAHNLRTVVVTDCVGDRAIAPHEANLFDMGQKYADLMPLADLRQRLTSHHAASLADATI
ncbi:isochorismatase family protein [Bradyrhizobium oligotrophicum]|uniref:isochorismatase family protein n=1 Tax=Bradyrhizobium oligotrophicum TaxID=44255 RepID=UPI003EBC9AB2